MNWSALAFVLVFFGTIGFVTGTLAARKGYQFWPWVFAGGIIGLLALAFLPFANAPGLSEIEKVQRLEKGNRLGRNLAIVSILFFLVRLMAAS